MTHAAPPLTPAAIRAAISDTPKTRARDLAQKLGITEAQLVAAQTGHGATRIVAHPDRVIPGVESLGEVMALTRNASCVSEKVGTYRDYRPGDHAAMVLGDAIDLRFFPAHWATGFAVETEGDSGAKRSLQFFDAAGDAVHKVHLRAASDLVAWDRLVAALATGDASDTLTVAPRKPTDAPKADPARADILRAEWRRMTDTHQFLRLCAKLKMNRLGAYRLAGAPFARALAPAAVDLMLHGVRDNGTPVMIFVGNRGCIQIHSGPIHRLQAMGPWQNILDPGFDLHLRLDHIAEVWAVKKPTQRGPALSVEAFDAAGSLILQAFPVVRDAPDSAAPWPALLRGLPEVATADLTAAVTP